MPANDRPLSPDELDELLKDYAAGGAARERRASKESTDSEQPEEESLDVAAESRATEAYRSQAPPGTLELIGGNVFFHPPRRGGRYPTIAPGPYVEVRVNGATISGPTQVRAEDSVEVLPADVEPQVVYDVEVTDGGLEAYLSLHKKPGLVVSVMDSPPRTALRPRGIVQDRPLPSDPTETDIVEELARQGIVFGLDMEVIRALASGELEGKQRVAVGWPAKPSQDARIEYHFEPKERRPYYDPETGRVDYYQAEEVPNVAPGTVIAVRHPPVEGEAGMSVYGKELLPAKPKDVTLQAREGTELSEDGNSIIATREGRPERKGEQFFVLPVLMVKGNIGLETGNVKYRGDVVVAGDVEEQARIEATGRIEVKGNVIRAQLIAQGGARLGQVVGGKVIVGVNAVYKRLHEEIAAVGTELGQLIGATEQLLQTFSQRASFVPPHDQLIVYLLDKKYSGIPSAVEALLGLIEKLDFDLEIDVRPALQALERYTHPTKRVRVRSLEDLEKLLEEIRTLENALQEFHSTPAHVIAGSTQHADIRATGEVHILGQGGYHSEVVADGTVVVHGIYRGGKIESKGNVFVGELGSPAGVKTTVRIEPGKYVCARKLYVGTEVRGGTHPWVASLDSEMAEIYVSTQGNVEVRASHWRPPPPPKFDQRSSEEAEVS